MRRFLAFFSLTVFAFLGISQVVIESHDMPVPNDIIKFRSINNTNGLNYAQTDTSFIWNLYTLPTGTEDQDTFVSVYSTPLIYNVVFSNPFDQEHKATVAFKQDMLNLYVITITDSYSFLKNSDTQFSMVGTGARINGIAIPMKYDNPDVWYHFPITYGTKDSSDSEFHANIPTLGYYGEQKHRVNQVDGWGTLILPTDTFDVIRVKSVVRYSDTIYLDTIGFGFKINRTETEYKWLAAGIHEPVLQITKRGLNSISAKYYYHIPVGLSVNSIVDNAPIQIYPNPASDKLTIILPRQNEDFVLRILDVTGREILRNNYQKNISEIELPIKQLQKGLYFIGIVYSTSKYSGKFLKF